MLTEKKKTVCVCTHRAFAGFDHLSFKVQIKWSCARLKPRLYACSPQVFPSEDAGALIVPDCHQRDLCDLILFSYSDSLAAVMNISDVHFFIFDLSRRRSGAPSEFEMLYITIFALSASQTPINILIFFFLEVSWSSYP